MARTTSAAVKALLDAGRDYDSALATPLTPFVDSANALVTRVEACAIAKGETMTSTELELIERWVAAWFYKGADAAYQSKSTAGASGQYQGQAGMFLEDNRYGQRAKSLDFSGCLIELIPGADGKRARAFGRWLGKRPSVQRDYVDRR